MKRYEAESIDLDLAAADAERLPGSIRRQLALHREIRDLDNRLKDLEAAVKMFLDCDGNNGLCDGCRKLARDLLKE